MNPLPPALLALAAALASALPAGAQEADRAGPPAFVPLESPAVAAQVRDAGALAAEGRHGEAAAAYQAIVDGPLWDRLVPLARDPDTLEQARERALREIALHPPLLEAWRRRFGETAASLEEAARRSGDPAALRLLFARFPLSGPGARAGLALARDAHRRGLPGEALGILDRMLDLPGPGEGGDLPPADLLALRAAGAAAAGDADLLEATLALAAPRAAEPGPGGGTLGAFLAATRASLPGPRTGGPRGPLVLLWQWRPSEASLQEDPEVAAVLPVNRSELPPRADHLLALGPGVAYWSDPLQVTAIDLATGRERGRSFVVSARARGAAPGLDHHGETFAPAADGEGVVAALDLADPGPGGRRVGTLNLLDPTLRLLVRRGGEGDVEHPGWARRFVFHGRPLLLGDRVYVAASEAAGVNPAGDVRTHVLAFRRSDLEPLWDTFLAYGSGIHASDVSPAGSIAHRHGRLYLSTHTGLEACLDARTGSVLWAHRYRTPEMAPTPRLAGTADRTMAPVLWYECPPVFSGDRVAMASRDSYTIRFLRQRPLRDSGRVQEEELVRPRQDNAALTTLWVLPGPGGSFFLAGQSSGPGEAPLLLRDLDPEAENQVPWRGPVMEPTIAGLPVRTPDALYLATEKALYRVPFPGRDGEIEVLATLPPRDGKSPRPSAGNLLVLPDRILSVADDGVMCFGPPPPTTPR